MFILKLKKPLKKYIRNRAYKLGLDGKFISRVCDNRTALDIYDLTMGLRGLIGKPKEGLLMGRPRYPLDEDMEILLQTSIGEETLEHILIRQGLLETEELPVVSLRSLSVLKTDNRFLVVGGFDAIVKLLSITTNVSPMIELIYDPQGNVHVWEFVYKKLRGNIISKLKEKDLENYRRYSPDYIKCLQREKEYEELRKAHELLSLSKKSSVAILAIEAAMREIFDEECDEVLNNMDEILGKINPESG